MAKRILILGVDGVMGAGLVIVRDLFMVANRIAARISGSDDELFDIGLYSLDGSPIYCSNAYTLGVEGKLPELNGDEVVFLPAFSITGRRELAEVLAREPSQALVSWLSENGAKAELLATNCSGVFMLAEAGLLANGIATTAWWLHELMEQRYPNITVEREALCIRSGNILTGGATGSLNDVCLSIIEHYAGRHFARLVAKYMMIDVHRPSQVPYSILTQFENDDPLVERAEQWIRKHLAEEFRIETLAEEMAVSPRTLIRRFQKALGESPQSFTQRLRIEKSKILLETTQLRFSEIVRRCGYGDESAFRRLFKRYCQLSPTEYRRRFSGTSVAVE